jgi:Collagen triple helix repeat (20 copies)
MFSKARRHINPTTGIALVALIFALTGGAYAASSHGGSQRAQASASTGRAGSNPAVAAKKSKSKGGARGPAGPKGASGPAGPAGSTGPTGSTGPAGATGPAGPTGGVGPQGPQGAQGEKGIQGEPGKNGTNGKNGTTGFTKTLPEKETETGAWAFEPVTALYERVAISFPIPLAAELPAEHVHFINERAGVQVEEPGEKTPISSACPGTVHEPKATPGNLCVYAFTLHPETVEIEENGAPVEVSLFEGWSNPGESRQAGESDPGGASTAGAMMNFRAAEGATGFGTWAVTAPE